MNKEIIYFNNAATSWPKPKIVTDLVLTSQYQPYHEHGRSTISELKDYVTMTRKQLAFFFNCHENYQQVIFTSSATESLNMLIHGYTKNREKTHVITSELEHNSVLRPLYTLQNENKIDLSIIPFNEDGYVSLQTIEETVKENTGLVVLTHGSNVLGTLQDISNIGNYLRGKDIFFIVDAAQTAGFVDINLHSLSIDGLVFTGHKGLYGFQGIGGFYIRNPQEVSSHKQGGTGVLSQHLLQPDELPLKYEAGTINYPGIVSLYAGIQFIQQIGLQNIYQKTMQLTNYTIEQLAKIDSIIVYNKKPDLPIISFNIEGLHHDDVGFILEQTSQIITRTGLHCAPLVHKRINEGKGCVRVSCSYFNTLDECNLLIDSISKITDTKQKKPIDVHQMM